MLHQHGFHPELLVLPGKVDKRLIKRAIRHHQPKLICLTSVSMEHAVIEETAAYLKHLCPEAFFLVGGPHVTLNPNEVMGSSFDAVCLGEGEYPTLDIATQIRDGKRPSRVDGVLFASEHNQGNLSRGQFIRDLDQLPLPNREMWDTWCVFPKRIHTILVSRGCPYKCSYCCNHILRKVSHGEYVRYRSPECVVHELESVLRHDPKTTFIYFESECFNADIFFALSLSDKLRRFQAQHDVRIRFGANIKVIPGQDYDQLFYHLSEAGFLLANVGLESGNDRLRRQILRRAYTNRDVKNVVNAAKAHGLFVRLYAMIGIPGETVADFQDTISCVKELQPDVVDLSYFYPYPGTDAYRMCVEQGLLGKLESPKAERRRPAYSLPGFTLKEMRREYRSFFSRAQVPPPWLGLIRFLKIAGLIPPWRS